MNSDLIPSSQPSHSLASEQGQSQQNTATGHEMSTSSENTSAETTENRYQPIPPPSEPMQYRAIGLVRGRYCASTEQLTQGTLVATDGTELDAVLLGRIISLVRNHLDLEQEHLWVVYPRIGQKQDILHLQIVGVWEPEKLSKESPATARPQPEEELETSQQPPPPLPEIEDGYFSIRGEVVYQSHSDSQLVVKIKQAPRKESEKPKYFKLKLEGVLEAKAVGQFWDLQVKRQSETLVVQHGAAIATLPSKPKPARNRFHPSKGPTGRRGSDTPLPRKPGRASAPILPLPKKPTPKPIKRQKPPQ